MSRSPAPRPLTIPPGATAQRPVWASLPTSVRAAVQRLAGSAVVESVSQGSGFTPGFASRLLLADGRHVFAKAASEAKPWLLTAYREEARKLALLPPAVPDPRLRAALDQVIDGDAWIVLVFDDVSGRPPQRPWRLEEAVDVLDQVTTMSAVLDGGSPGRGRFPRSASGTRSATRTCATTTSS